MTNFNFVWKCLSNSKDRFHEIYPNVSMCKVEEVESADFISHQKVANRFFCEDQKVADWISNIHLGERVKLSHLSKIKTSYFSGKTPLRQKCDKLLRLYSFFHY